VTGLQGIGSSLTYLDLSQNEISDIGSLSSLTGLQTLYLSTNQITNITPLIDLTSLTYLNLDNNQISDGAPTGSLTALTDLELDSNQLSSIGFLQTLTNLQILHLSTNSIVDITPLKYLTDLQDLNLSDNYLTDDCFQILEENGLWKIADINGKQKFDLLAYESYVKSFLNNASANITILKPSGTTPTNETPLAVGDETKPLELDYNFSNVLSNGHMPNFDDLQQFEQYLSQIKVYVNGAYDEELTGSLSFDTEGSTLNPDSELTLILDHTIPFPDASTITVDVPQLLFLNGGRPL
jgi:Leucine-rich repeat (LRR) protein